jgi:2-polyprenyl-3-methyl-5-hydroxy-6-metoxy-1,4-benzoquinol methylase
MRTNDLTTLNVSPKYISDIFAQILEQVEGAFVLNVGAAGGVRGYLPNNRDIWLHHRLSLAASELLGADIDTDGIAYAKDYGVEIEYANCESMELGRKFDAIVLSDVIEHMNAPVTGVSNLMKHLRPDGKLFITTPNPTAMNLLARAILGRNINSYWDHVSCFSPEHIQTICDRCGYRMSGVYFFDHIDRQNISNTIKSHVARMISRINPRLATSYMAIIEHK